MQYRDAKPVRDLEAILQREYDLQRIDEAENADQVQQAAAEDLQQDAMSIATLPQMDLAGLPELTDMLAEYYHAELSEINKEDSSAIHSLLDFKDSAFDLDFEGNVAQEDMPDIDFGSNQESFDLADVL